VWLIPTTMRRAWCGPTPSGSHVQVERATVEIRYEIAA
jgi:hypothetical protein